MVAEGAFAPENQRLPYCFVFEGDLKFTLQ